MSEPQDSAQLYGLHSSNELDPIQELKIVGPMKTKTASFGNVSDDSYPNTARSAQPMLGGGQDNVRNTTGP